MSKIDVVSTPVDSISKIASSIRSTFASHKTQDIEYRLVQLRKLYWSIIDHQDEVAAACKADLGKGSFETYLTETGWTANDCIYAANNLKKWAADESLLDQVDLANKFMSPKVRKDPLGAVLIIGTYNFPFQLTLGPLIGAVAAGCTAVLKPSENAPHAAKVVQKIVEKALDPSAYAIVQGAVPETTALLDQKWDLIFYTGGYNVARIISKKAADTLTPVVLELGGKNPAIITKNADVRLAARRLLWGKTFNAGQVCVSQNYIMIDQEKVQEFLTHFRAAIKEFYPNGPRASPDYGRIINERQWSRLKKMLESTSGRIVIGGEMDEAEKFLEPTVIQVESENDALLSDESFGPLIPILPVRNLDQAIRIANEVSGTPLGLYAFGNSKETSRMLRETRSGGATINDAFFHASIPTIPFGGVGESGTGAYRGKASYDCFTHRRTVVQTPNWIESILAVRYPPFEGTGKLKQFRLMADLKPNFDRNGHVKVGVLSWVLSLGGKTFNAGLIRWLLVALSFVGYQKYQGNDLSYLTNTFAQFVRK